MENVKDSTKKLQIYIPLSKIAANTFLILKEPHQITDGLIQKPI